ncbi:MerR family transcriptional regulator [Paenibacillus sp. GYB004]|uniref:MerR family transcriptional regulator n=1 Tax=Paenibacillus sp. GYB004 TaxID=2994393 RepID=UPI002F962952
MRIGELAAKTGASLRSLRYYEQQKLISPFRADNGYREYSPFAVEQVETIRFYINLGFTTEQIAGFLHSVMQNKEAFCRDVLPVYETKIAELEEQIQLLSRIKSNLEERVRAMLDEQEKTAGSCANESLLENGRDPG